MAAVAPAPPLSVRGTWRALRIPTGHDILFSAKAALAASLCLLIGFSQHLENPYWSALTVYVLVGQPEAGAIRSKAVFRLVGTLVGGVISILLGMAFASNVGALLIASIIAILITYYPKTLDRTPTSYTWFSAPLTIAVIAVTQAPVPGTIFMSAMTRMAEISLAILMVGLVDSAIAPRTAMPAFVRTMTDWRDRASDWAGAALAPDASAALPARQERRLGLHKLAGLLVPLDGLAVQLPYDIVPRPPARREMRLIRLTIAHLIAHFGSANIWVEAARCGSAGAEAFETLVRETRDWLLDRHALDDPALLDHAACGEQLSERLAAFETHMALAQDDDTLVRAVTLLRLVDLVEHWSRMEKALHAIATGTALPRPLAIAARRAKPVRSTDFLLGLLDIVPLALALTLCAALWYFTTWTASIAAMVFVFISLGFVIGTPGALQAANGITVWISGTSVAALVYQFVVLPRVTAFPVLLGVLLVVLFPLGLLAAMSPAGVLMLANGFAFLGLQSAYTADANVTLELLFGSLAGCFIAAAALHLCRFDRGRFQARRLELGLREDLIDLARSRRIPVRDRFLSLSVDRMALYYGIVDALPPADPLHRADLIDTFRTAANLLRMRLWESSLSDNTAASVRIVRAGFAALCEGQRESNREQLLGQVRVACRAALAENAGPVRTQMLAALVGLRLSLTAPPAFPHEGEQDE